MHLLRTEHHVRWWGALTGISVVVILIAGLWPFRPLRNDVRSMPVGRQFGRHGIAMSAARFPAVTPGGPCSLEVLFTPKSASAAGTILAFDDASDPLSSFAIRQSADNIAVQRPWISPEGKIERLWWRTSRVLEPGKARLLTLVSTGNDSILYINGRQSSAYPGYGLTSAHLSGTLVVGTGTTGDDWHGIVTGLALYYAALPPAVVREHSRKWIEGEIALNTGEPSPVAFYDFRGSDGNAVRDLVGRNDLSIPASYRLVHRDFISPVWVQFQNRWNGWQTWSYWSDVLWNSLGFIPLGFCTAAWLGCRVPSGSARVMAGGIAFVLSFAVESAQYCLPTRHSSMTDLLTNTLGALAGTLLWRASWAEKITVCVARLLHPSSGPGPMTMTRKAGV